MLNADFEQVSLYLHFFNDTYCSWAIVNGLFRVVSRMSPQLPLTAKILYLVTLSNLMFNYYVYIPPMATTLLSDFTVHFDNIITLEDCWLESTTEILVS